MALDIYSATYEPAADATNHDVDIIMRLYYEKATSEFVFADMNVVWR